MRRFLIAAALACLAITARAEQKNVQILTGLSDAELQRNMQLIRSALGVNCDFCHMPNEQGKIDFASDAKKEKETARDMIQMTQKLNREQFGGRAMISCNTCHRGAVNPVALVSLPQAVPQSTPPPARPALPSLADIVKHYTAALGDVARLQSARILHGTREGWDGKPLPMEIEETPEKMHTAVTTPAGRIEQWSNEIAGWSTDAKGVRPLTADQLEMFHQLTAAYEPMLPAAIPQDARVIAKQKIGDRDTILVAARLDEKTRERLYFDETTGLLMRRMVIRDGPIGPIPQQTDYDDYRDVSGTKFPFTVRLSLVDPWTSSTRRYTDVQLGAKVDDSVFTPPAETRPSS